MFLTIRAEGAGDRSPWGDFWFKSAERIGAVDGDQAMRLSAVLRCVRLLSDTLSQLPFTIYRRRSDGSRQQLRDHWLYLLFAVRPNAYQNPAQFRAMMQAHLELRGNAYAQIVSNSRGVITDLLPKHPDRVSIEAIGDSNWRYKVKNRDGTETILARGQMFHRHDLSLDGICGVNPIAYARDMLATGIAAQAYGRRFFENNGTPGGIVKVPYKFASDEQRRLARGRWSDALTGRNQGKLAVFELGEEFTPVTVTNADAQFIESKKYTVTDIARLFGVPPQKIGDLDRATNNNIEQLGLDYISDAVMPRSNSWASALKYDFLDIEDQDIEVELSLKPLQLMDSAARKNYYQGGIQSGWMTRNEARLAEGMDPIEGLDKPLQPVNMQPLNKDGQVDQTESDGNEPKRPGAPDAVPNDQPGRPTDARALALATAAAERIAKKEAAEVGRLPVSQLDAYYSKHAAFVSAALGLSIDVGRAYVNAQRDLYESMEGSWILDHYESSTRERLIRVALGMKP